MAILRWVVLAALVLPSQVHATLLAMDRAIPGDGRITYDTDSGLRWLDLAETLGLPMNVILVSLGNPEMFGWQYATRAEVCGLLESRAGPTTGCTGSGETIAAGVAELLEFLGITDSTSVPGYVSSFGFYATGEVQMARSLGGVFAAAFVLDHSIDPRISDLRYGHFLVQRVPEPSIAALFASFALAGVAQRILRMPHGTSS